MPGRKYPLSLVLRAHGPAELLNADEESLWASDADDDFREEFNDEFLHEDDFDDILDYLYDTGIISMNEFDNFDRDKWHCDVEVLDQDAGPDDDDDEDEEED